MENSLAALRAQTSCLHKELELTSVSRDLMSENLDFSKYTNIIEIWEQAWKNLESVLFEQMIEAEIELLVPAPRAHLLTQDLAYLKDQINPKILQSSASKNLLKISELKNTSNMLGICYVLRGSTLGGQVIAKHLEKTLGVRHGSGASFFALQVAQKSTWPKWCESLNKYVSTQRKYENLASGTQLAFQYLIECFNCHGDGNSVPMP